ncbi:MAG TPA: hypothetical protein VKE94_06750 [Gemmataceae bacterium]|nr:hypothetical protein [Gemmataceae bacterium]
MVQLSVPIVIAILANHGVSQLGAYSFQEREAAQRLVEVLGNHAQPALVRGLNAGDVEVRTRCERALCKLDGFGFTIMPRIDCFPEATEKAEIILRKSIIRRCIDEALSEAGDLRPRPPDDWLQRRATVHLSKLLIKTECSRKEIRTFLLRMQEIEVKRIGARLSTISWVW